MSSKKINKLFNKILIVLFFLLIITYFKDRYEKSYSYSDKKDNKVINNDLDIYYFNVGQADSIFIKNGEYNILIDAGNMSDGSNISKYLSNEIKIDTINYLFGTHPHEDHVGGIYDIINDFNVENIYFPDAISNAKYFERILDIIEEKNLKITIPKEDDVIEIGDLKFYVLSALGDEKNLNDSSIVLKLVFKNTTYLFMGDASLKVEKNIINKDIRSDVLKVGHHGSNYSSSLKFLERVSPKYSIIEVGKDNKYNHPNSDVLKNLSKVNSSVYRTDVDGTIKITSDGDNISINKLNVDLNG